LERIFITVSRYVKTIKIHQDFPELWSQMYCHIFYEPQCIYMLGRCSTRHSTKQERILPSQLQATTVAFIIKRNQNLVGTQWQKKVSSLPVWLNVKTPTACASCEWSVVQMISASEENVQRGFFYNNWQKLMGTSVSCQKPVHIYIECDKYRKRQTDETIQQNELDLTRQMLQKWLKTKVNNQGSRLTLTASEYRTQRRNR